MDIDFETTPNQQTKPMEAMCSQTNTLVYKRAPISDNKVAFTNESNGESNNGNENDNDKESNSREESEDDEDDIVEIEVKEFDSKGQSIEFFNKLLLIYKQNFQLPLSLSGLQSMTGFSAMTKEIKRLVTCQDCYKMYEESIPAPFNCDFIKLCAHTACDCKLMIQSLSGEFKITHTLCNIYDGEAWTGLKDNNNKIFVENFRSLMMTLNINWFQPFDGTSYSCGAIYLVINNLSRNGATVRAALLMVACNISAAKKTSGFSAHNSTCACYKFKRVHAEEWNSASTPSERQQLEIEYGVQWSQLYRLGYFDPTVAVMMILPSDFTKLKKKVGKSFSHMKADEWKPWILMYSPMLLKPVLLSNMFNGWIDYVKAYCVLVKPSISFINIDHAHSYLQELCQSCEDTYEPKVLTCNMHLHLNLHDTIRDFGPVYGYWLFGFKIYNGLLKNNKKNKKDRFETTYMTKLTADAYKAYYVQNILSCSSLIPFLSLLEKCISTTAPITTYVTYAPTNQQPFQLQQFVNSSLSQAAPIKGNEPLPPFSFPLQSLKKFTMSNIDYPQLLDYYKIAYAIPNLISYHNARLSQYFVNNQMTILKSIDLLGQTYIGNNSSGKCGSLVKAFLCSSNSRASSLYTGQIQYLFIHSFTLPSQPNHQASTLHQDQHVFAYIQWYNLTNDNEHRDEGIEIYLPDFSADNYHDILPVHCIHLEIATAVDVTDMNEERMLVIPMPKNTMLEAFMNKYTL
ncbi:hypothetical protein PHYBLDRAFT_152965 [Phycomyces blakesleeanus NRRL 1555(-)]|uniref:Uncharacterized protein n=1 Tax=Phycomyces blakesleeanus (strain ATCC 8743b / DSM 1359 / FGSC 10004 / NBRC 33097 / NRRL 1555) TaxID=763407 RepID=A0A167JGM0_PHYB8|nr:hypothetical protein PHYBLDRAFT_152965 [Phycomyces blakesleeanus NRRL 1555(-)]OAD65938.1 hypothetical protein PHYBLDRAFT_152965 [Phycomyces blakesleeanus NRRL 1555(-)]|eukprot:XP_018283978.1 hypothetical protein PHYBLDRAFT_152965 [Phycomyces blakesleeanus NRRL 1555(-)]